MNKNFVAFLDVLGFTARIASDDPLPFVREYLECLQKANAEKKTNRVEYIAFSDSIVLTTKDDSEASFLSLLRNCSMAFGLTLKKSIPLRGAIAYGTTIRTSQSSGVFVAGKPIIEAVEYEKRQDWIGIMLAPSVVQHFPNLEEKCLIPQSSTSGELDKLAARMNWASFLQRSLTIPFHGHSPTGWEGYTGFAVVPSDGKTEPTILCQSLNASIGALQRMESFAPDPPAQAKYGRTEQWCRHICDKWQKVVRLNAIATK